MQVLPSCIQYSIGEVTHNNPELIVSIVVAGAPTVLVVVVDPDGPASVNSGNVTNELAMLQSS